MYTQRLEDFAHALAPRLTGTLRRDAMTRALYSTDASMYQQMPLAVLIPRHADDVQAALEEAARFGLPVLPRGGGSSLAGQTVNEAIVIDFSRHLDAVLGGNIEEGWVRVQPGLVLDRLQRWLLREMPQWTVGPDPASHKRATLGGMLANNSTGTHSILYGNFIHHLREARALLADGTPVTFPPLDAAAWAARTRQAGREGDLYRALDTLITAHADPIRRDTPRHWRRNSGYRLEALLEDQRHVGRLLCGSEGTLAVVTELTLGLVPRPKRTALGIVHYRTRREALQSVTTILATAPAAVELFDGHTLRQAKNAPGFAHRFAFVQGMPGALLMTEYFGETDDELRARLDRLEAVLAQAGQGYAVVRLTDSQSIQNAWGVREESLGLIMNVRGDLKPLPFIEDASVPVEHLADYIDELVYLCEATHTPVAMYAHASAGCLHVRPFINTKDAREVEKMRDLAEGSMALVRKYGGAVSSEHADGRARSWLNPPLLGAALYGACVDLKRAFDPENRLNPGNKVEAPPMTEALRMGPAYATIPVLDDLDFSAEGGFAQAVEMCNGNGACRKLEGGTMCPSFMVTREEQDSTRGRANALRLAMSGALPQAAFTGPEMVAVMDLCIQCKACKTECPSNVDLAKLKTNWLAQYWRDHPMPLRTRLLAHQPMLARQITGPVAKAVNWMNRQPAVRRLLEARLGLSAHRMLPPFAEEPFTEWFRRQDWANDGPPVVLFADTFNNYHHPEVARAAATFLHRVGYRVVVPAPDACCGRPLLSKGLVAKARSLAAHTVEKLYPYAAQGWPIVGLEPSCLLTFTDEFQSLLPGEAKVQAVAAAARLFESFVAEEADAGRLDGVHWRGDRRQVLLHGHCHQKALVGTGPSERALALPGHTVETVDAGCCGMAGAFGYEAEHFAVSQAMGERVLLPAVRAAAPDTLLAAAGTSCRAQIADLAHRTAQHPAEILLEALA
jgi:FAD/FMN-containing dehydrogenase/Fe-S oxidoreductase